MKRATTLKALYFGTPVVLISSLNDDGTTNLAPMSSAWWLGRTAVLGMGTASQTVHNLRARPECVLNLVDGSMVAAVDRLALLTGRPDVPEHKQARGYTYEADKFSAAGLTPVACGPGSVRAVAECPVHLESRVQAMHPVQGADSGLLAIEVRVLSTHVEEHLMLQHHRDHVDPLGWDPLIMKFTEYFAGGSPAYPSSLARGWGMPPMRVAG